MAKKTEAKKIETKAAPRVVEAAKEDVEIVPAGEFVKNGSEPDFDSLMVADSALATLEKLQEADEEEFHEAENDYFKWEEPGQEIRGIYLGKHYKIKEGQQRGRYIHAFGVINKSDGKPKVLRCSGPSSLTKGLAPVPLNTPVWVKYVNDVQTGEAQPAKIFEVRRMKA